MPKLGSLNTGLFLLLGEKKRTLAALVEEVAILEQLKSLLEKKIRSNPRRSRAESVVALLEASRQVGIRHVALPVGVTHPTTGLNEWWVVTFPCPNAKHNHSNEIGFDIRERTCLKGQSNDLGDALAAAIEAKVRGEQDA